MNVYILKDVEFLQTLPTTFYFLNVSQEWCCMIAREERREKRQQKYNNATLDINPSFHPQLRNPRTIIEPVVWSDFVAGALLRREMLRGDCSARQCKTQVAMRLHRVLRKSSVSLSEWTILG